jgi:2-hydroxy-4-carboxymuconate semialdehyde hemiacetal dehydrogenase
MGVIHAKALAKIDGVEIVSIASRTEESGKAFAAEYKIPFASSSLEACIDRPGVDAVILTTPSDQHHDQTIMALGKGKHVQVEIPMALGLKDSEDMLDASRKAGKICMVTHTRRFSAPHREMKKRIREGKFHLHHLVVETYFFRRTNLNMHGQARSWVDNLLWHHGCHSVDIAQWVIDDPDWDAWGQKGPDRKDLGIPMDLSVCMKSKKRTLFTMAILPEGRRPAVLFKYAEGRAPQPNSAADAASLSTRKRAAARRSMSVAVCSSRPASALTTYPRAPVVNAASVTSHDRCSLTNRIFALGSWARIRRAAWIPSSVGSPTSKRIRSGFSSLAFSTASSPSEASPTIWH